MNRLEPGEIYADTACFMRSHTGGQKSIEIAARSADAICGATTAATNCLSLPYAEIAEDATRQHTRPG